MTWEILLGSAVIAASISGVVAIVTSRKENNLQHITVERKAWREEIRNIAEELHEAEYEQTLKILTKLKDRINACGLGKKGTYFIV